LARTARVERKTSEAKISINMNLDGIGLGKIETGIGYLNHILETLAKHSLFNLEVNAEGDLKHHVCEDVALALGKAMLEALGNKKGIRRFGSAYVSMEDSLSRAVVDLGGRAYANIELGLSQAEIEDMKTEDVNHFLSSFAQASMSNLHLAVLYGENDHHKVESSVKALALALREAVALEPRASSETPSVKGIL